MALENLYRVVTPLLRMERIRPLRIQSLIVCRDPKINGCSHRFTIRNRPHNDNRLFSRKWASKKKKPWRIQERAEIPKKSDPASAKAKSKMAGKLAKVKEKPVMLSSQFNVG
jgi:hypothetical protein